MQDPRVISRPHPSLKDRKQYKLAMEPPKKPSKSKKHAKDGKANSKSKKDQRKAAIEEMWRVTSWDLQYVFEGKTPFVDHQNKPLEVNQDWEKYFRIAPCKYLPRQQ